MESVYHDLRALGVGGGRMSELRFCARKKLIGLGCQSKDVRTGANGLGTGT